MSAIYWMRRDLRLEDNQTLHAALEHKQVIPVYILDPFFEKSTSQLRKDFLNSGLRKLDDSLRQRGNRLILRAGSPVETLHNLLQETKAEAIYTEEDFTPYARKRDAKIAKNLNLNLVQGQLTHHPMATLKRDGTPYTVYTPFSKTWKTLLPLNMEILPAPDRIPAPAMDIYSEEFPVAAESANFPAGEAEARRRLNDFIKPETGDGIFSYAAGRDRLDLGGTSSLSPYLHFGMLGLRETVQQAREAIRSAPDAEGKKGVITWLNQLIWREFYIHILYHFPHVREKSFRERYDQICWENDPEIFEAWKVGQTGYPVVDAGMRQLLETGWMHNRARMIVASFLVKDLLIDWRLGEAWFMQNLLDADVAANNGGWQWVAGVGTDAAPYFRIFNPVLQSKKFDPEGEYIRRWVPELAHLSQDVIHEPWKKGNRPDGYPAPIIDHGFARERTLAAYKAL